MNHKHTNLNSTQIPSTLMNLNMSVKNNFQIKTSALIDEQLMICSHERSGTHFLMNTMDTVSHYSAKPWVNYDLHPLGGKLNFFSKKSTRSFIKSLSSIKINEKKACNCSMLKSHFPLSHLGQDTKDLPIKIIYIWRDPVETITSLWKYMHKWEWNEGPKVETPLALATSRPSGQSQRYQASNYKDYFERWAAHVLDGISHCENNPKACVISYKELLHEHTATTINICKRLNINILQKPALPSKNKNVISGAHMNLNLEDITRLREFCAERLEDFPELKARISNI